MYSSLYQKDEKSTVVAFNMLQKKDCYKESSTIKDYRNEKQLPDLTRSFLIQRNEIEGNFKPGDKVYGLSDDRDKIIEILKNKGTSGDHPTIDTLNQMLQVLGGAKNIRPILDGIEEKVKKGEASQSENEAYFFGKQLIDPKNSFPEESDDDIYKNIRKACKQAIVSYTENDKTIHFEMKSFKSDRFNEELKGLLSGELDKDEKGITGSELRSIMRVYMKEKGIISGLGDQNEKKQGTNLTNIVFYFDGKQIDSPWTADLNSELGKAYKGYLEYRAKKK